jgi:2-oxoglutarate ferredoxin oxidoreductase subunit alpha
MIGFTQMTIEPRPTGTAKPPPEKPWALDGTSGGTGRSKVVWTWRQGKHNTPGPGPNRHWQSVAEKYDRLASREARHVTRHVEHADVVVVSFGTTGAFVDYVVEELRADGHRIGTFRPVTLWPFPNDALGTIARSDACKLVLVHELNAGQMIDDVRLAVEGAKPVRGIGGVSQDESGMRQGELLDVEIIRMRILEAMTGAKVMRTGR